MPWFKVPDELSVKIETTRIPRVSRTSAIGLLTLAGSWSARELTDGHIPTHMVDELCGTPEDAQWLVSSGFWIDVEDGWEFVVWAPDQPLREVVLAERAKKAEKMRDWRSRNQPSNPSTEPTTGVATGETTGRATSAASKEDRVETVEPAPYPDPSLLEAEESFATWWEVFPRREGRADARRAYAAALKTTPASEILAGTQAYALLRAGEDKTFTKMPAGFLRDQRWRDIPPQTAPTVSGIVTPPVCPDHGYPPDECPYCEPGVEI